MHPIRATRPSRPRAPPRRAFPTGRGPSVPRSLPLFRLEPVSRSFLVCSDGVGRSFGCSAASSHQAHEIVLPGAARGKTARAANGPVSPPYERVPARLRPLPRASAGSHRRRSLLPSPRRRLRAARAPRADPSARDRGPRRSKGVTGPASVMAKTAASSTRLYSYPPSLAHGPFGACTVRMAVIMVALSRADAAGVNAPAAMKTPPLASARARREGVRLAGSQAQRLKELTGGVRPVTAKLAGELLHAMPHEQASHHGAQRPIARASYLISVSKLVGSVAASPSFLFLPRTQATRAPAPATRREATTPATSTQRMKVMPSCYPRVRAANVTAYGRRPLLGAGRYGVRARRRPGCGGWRVAGRSGRLRGAGGRLRRPRSRRLPPTVASRGEFEQPRVG